MPLRDSMASAHSLLWLLTRKATWCGESHPHRQCKMGVQCHPTEQLFLTKDHQRHHQKNQQLNVTCPTVPYRTVHYILFALILHNKMCYIHKTSAGPSDYRCHSNPWSPPGLLPRICPPLFQPAFAS